MLAALATALLLALAGNAVVGFSVGPPTGSCAPALSSSPRLPWTRLTWTRRLALAPSPAVGVCAGRQPVTPRGLQRLRADAGVYTVLLPRRAVRHVRMRL